MSVETQIRDLCSTCDNAPDCALPASHKKPVWHCEEFYCNGASAKKSTEAVRQPVPSASAIVGDDAPKFIGLCSDCENRETCMFPKPEGGIWHCEEYR